MTSDSSFTRWQRPPGVWFVVLALCCLTASISWPAEQAVQPASRVSPRDALETYLRRQTEPYRNVTRIKVGVIADTHIESQYGIDKTFWKETLAWWKGQGCS